MLDDVAPSLKNVKTTPGQLKWWKEHFALFLQDPIETTKDQATKSQLSKGVVAFFVGVKTALITPGMRKYIAASFLASGIALCGLFVLSFVCYSFFRVLFYIPMLWYPQIDDHLYYIFTRLLFLIPAFFLSALRVGSRTVLKISDEMFLTTLEQLDPNLHRELAHRDRIPFKEWITLYARRQWKLIRLGLMVYIWYQIPYIGLFAIPYAQFNLAQRLIGRKGGFIFGVLILITSFNPTLSHLFTILFRYWISTLSLSRELLEPYFCRMKDYRKNPAILRQRYFRMMFSYAIPWVLVISIPVAGIPFYFLAIASSSALCVVIVDAEEKRRYMVAQAEKQKKERDLQKNIPFD